MIEKSSSFWHSFWRDHHGNIVIFQMPNFLLWAYIVSVLLHRFVSNGVQKTQFELLGFSTLFAWAYLEITTGVNYFRRVLGIGALIGLGFWLFGYRLPF